MVPILAIGLGFSLKAIIIAIILCVVIYIVARLIQSLFSDAFIIKAIWVIAVLLMIVVILDTLGVSL